MFNLVQAAAGKSFSFARRKTGHSSSTGRTSIVIPYSKVGFDFATANASSKLSSCNKKAFGAELLGRAAGPDGKTVMHAEMKIGNSRFFLADEFPQMGCRGPKSLGGSPLTIHRYVEDVDVAFNKAVAAGAQAQMPVSDMFWGDRYGVVVDPFGHQWSIATHVRDVSPEEIRQAASVECAS